MMASLPTCLLCVFFSGTCGYVWFDCVWSSDVCYSDMIGRFFFFFQAEDGIRDFDCDWSSDVCSSDLVARVVGRQQLDRHRPIEPHFAGEIHDSHAAAPQLELQRIAPGERGLEVEEEAVGLVGHEAMLPYCRLYRPLPPAFRFTPLCLTTKPTSLQPSRPP